MNEGRIRAIRDGVTVSIECPRYLTPKAAGYEDFVYVWFKGVDSEFRPFELMLTASDVEKIARWVEEVMLEEKEQYTQKRLSTGAEI